MIPRTISPTELRQNLYAVVREVALGQNQYLVTPGDAQAVVMISREDYNALLAERNLLRDLRRAEADVSAGRTSDTRAVRAALARRGSRRSVGKVSRKRK